MSHRFDTEKLLDCYRRGVFPMADSRDDMNLLLISPEVRGVLPLDGFHVPRRLRKTVRKDPFHVTVDMAFNRVIDACAEEVGDRPTTWINAPIQNMYAALHRQGHAHSIECWENGHLVGGLYGVSQGAAFFGESMFSRRTDASKVALVHLVARLIEGGYQLLDAQFHNPHLEQFGLIEMSKKDFMQQLTAALEKDADFYSSGTAGSDRLSGDGCLQRITQTS
ncbi:leucyl/phenylalanyl-tRNA--protein transferase [Henriciella litoralis]|uniref:leucyl/phenylalanyl-tRNA--protein transferase n=1 Tax=Henriciella litoralis TaxID=568102 RepID=UPI0009FBEFD0|nr:leucyl/phenylalanyl-tRNA--protein transferase [Henriciella litoralis]